MEKDYKNEWINTRAEAVDVLEEIRRFSCQSFLNNFEYERQEHLYRVLDQWISDLDLI